MDRRRACACRRALASAVRASLQASDRRTPLRWLTEHRLELARRRLTGTDLGLVAIATEIGYASEFALSKTFKRLFGMSPGIYRRTYRAEIVSMHDATSVPRFRAAA